MVENGSGKKLLMPENDRRIQMKVPMDQDHRRCGGNTNMSGPGNNQGLKCLGSI